MHSPRKILAVLSCVPLLVLSAQVPFGADGGTVRWTDPPDVDSTSNHIFSSVHSLLDFLPNTISRTGHTLVPATVPAGTVLHHGAFSPTAPKDTFEWLAFDFEHAYVFNAGTNFSHMFRYAASRDLKLLYLDGASAASGIGAMHMQDILLYGEVAVPEREWYEDWPRAQALCDWGAPLGLDGFVRMEFHFEIIHCNFSSALTLLEHVVPPPKTPARTIAGDIPVFPGNWSAAPPPGWAGTLPSADGVFAQALVAGAWHAHAPGETRARVHRHLAVSFYDPALVSLRAARRGRPRAYHDLADISRADAHAKVAEIEGAVREWTAGGGAGSGADWGSALRQVEERYGARLLELNHTLHADSAYANSSVHAAAARGLVLIMLVPYMAAADFARAAPDSSAWLAPVITRCSAQATAGLRAVLDGGSFTRQEAVILDALEGTQAEICRVLGLVWLDAMGVEDAEEEEAGLFVAQWRTLVDQLLAWLDWASFRTCRPGCAADERCYVTTWPYRLPGDHPDDRSFQPRCMSLHPECKGLLGGKPFTRSGEEITRATDRQRV